MLHECVCYAVQPAAPVMSIVLFLLLNCCTTASDVSIFLTLLNSVVCVLFHSNACFEFVRALRVLMLRLMEGAFDARFSASWMNPLSSILAVGWGNSLIAWLSSLLVSAPLVVMDYPVYLMLSPLLISLVETCRLMLLHLASVD